MLDALLGELRTVAVDAAVGEVCGRTASKHTARCLEIESLVTTALPAWCAATDNSSTAVNLVCDGVDALVFLEKLRTECEGMGKGCDNLKLILRAAVGAYCAKNADDHTIATACAIVADVVDPWTALVTYCQVRERASDSSERAIRASDRASDSSK